MICPLTNTPEFKSSSARFGEEAAKRIYSIHNSFTPSFKDAKETSLLNEYYGIIGSGNLDYFINTYSDYLNPVLKGRSDVDSVVSAFAAWAIKNPNKGKFPPTNKYYYSPSGPSISTLESLLHNLAARFNFPYAIVYDKTDKRKGYYQFDGTDRLVVVNLAYATPDTPFHEYLHPFVRLLKTENPKMYDMLLDLADARRVPDGEEAVVEFLGKEAVKENSSIFMKFLSWLKSLLVRVFPKNRKAITDLSSISTLSELLDIVRNYNVDVSRENTLYSANQAASVYANAMGDKISEQFKFSEDVIAKVSLESDEYSTSDNSLYYQDKSGRDVALRATAFVGDSNVGVFSTKFRNKTDSMYVFRAQQTFKDAGVSLTDKIKISNGKEYTVDELAAYYETVGNEERLKGKLGHAYIEYRLQLDPAKKEHALAEASKYAELLYGPTRDLMTLPFVYELDRELQILLNISGIQYSVDETTRNTNPDRISSEVVLKSDLLVDKDGTPLATTADGLIQTAQGQIKLVDWKFGNITSDLDTSYFMAFGGSEAGVKDSKLDRGKLELVLRAVILKEKFPEAPFQFLKIISIGKDGYHNVYQVDMQPYLDLIGNYYKSTNPTVYKELTKRKLLDEKSYLGLSSLTVKYMLELDKYPSFSEKVQWVENRLNDLTLRGTLGELSPESSDTKKQRAALSQLYQELTKLPGTNLEKNVDDIPKVIGRLKNLSDVSHPMVQTLHTEILKRRNQKNKEFEDYAKESTRLLSKVLLESEESSKKRKLIRNILNTATLFGVATLNPILTFAPLAANIILRRTQKKVSESFAFMWQASQDLENPGVYLNTNDYYEVNGTVIPLTQAQKEYRDYVKESMNKLYTEVMGAPAFVTERGKAITKAEIMNRPLVLPPNFLPRFPKSVDELREEQAYHEGYFGIGPRSKDFFKRSNVGESRFTRGR